MTTTIVIIGSALSGNKGAAAMLEAAVEGLLERIPDSRFVLLSMYPDEDRALNTYEELEIVDATPLKLGVLINSLALAHKMFPPLRKLIRRNSRAIQALSEAKLLLDQGGITFSDGREKFLLYNIASVLPALNLGVPVVKCAQAVGPFSGTVNRIAAKFMLPRMELIFSRGGITHDMAVKLGLQNVQAGADLAFTLDENLAKPATRKEAQVGLSPSVVLQKKVDAKGGNYAEEMVHFAEYLVATGRRVLLVPHSARYGTTKTHNNDLPLCHFIYESLSTEARDETTFVDCELSPRELRCAIAECQAFVTSRFHAMVSGLATATPTLVIGWSHKYQEVLHMFESEEWAISHQEFSQDILRYRFELLWDEREAVSRQLIANGAQVRSNAKRQLDIITRLAMAQKPVQ